MVRSTDGMEISHCYGLVLYLFCTIPAMVLCLYLISTGMYFATRLHDNCASIKPLQFFLPSLFVLDSWWSPGKILVKVSKNDNDLYIPAPVLYICWNVSILKCTFAALQLCWYCTFALLKPVLVLCLLCTSIEMCIEICYCARPAGCIAGQSFALQGKFTSLFLIHTQKVNLTIDTINQNQLQMNCNKATMCQMCFNKSHCKCFLASLFAFDSWRSRGKVWKNDNNSKLSL